MNVTVLRLEAWSLSSRLAQSEGIAWVYETQCERVCERSTYKEKKMHQSHIVILVPVFKRSRWIAKAKWLIVSLRQTQAG